MKVGSLVFVTNQGLGILAKQFYDNGVVTDVCMIRHGRREEHPGWYPRGTPYILSLSQNIREIKEFCKSMDVMLFFETPFDWSLFSYCRENKVKTVLMTMYECTLRILPDVPDLFLCPSELDLRILRQRGYSRSEFLPVPAWTPWTQRTTATTYVHNAGHGGLKGRNGTSELIEAMRYVTKPIRLILRSQVPVDNLRLGTNLFKSEACIEYEKGNFHHSTLYKMGDVFVFPEKFNGLSLPLQEAYASGMLVMATNRFPMNIWLPNQPLIPVDGYRTSCINPRFQDYQEAILSPQRIAAVMDTWYEQDITTYSLMGKKYGETYSWNQLKPIYQSALLELS
jgi:hypothetical protein